MTRRKRPAPPSYMQPTYPPKFPGGVPPTDDSDAEKSARATSERLAQLEKLGKLHDSGVLNDQEFEREKRRILEQP